MPHDCSLTSFLGYEFPERPAPTIAWLRIGFVSCDYSREQRQQCRLLLRGERRENAALGGRQCRTQASAQPQTIGREAQHTRSPIVGMNPPIHQTASFQVVYQLTGADGINSEAHREPTPINSGLVIQRSEDCKLKRRQVL